MAKRLKRPWKQYNKMTWEEKMSLMEKEQQQEDKRQVIDLWGRCRSPHNTNSYLFRDMASSSFAVNDSVVEQNTMLNVDIDDLLARIGASPSQAPSPSAAPLSPTDAPARAHISNSNAPGSACSPTTPEHTPPRSTPDHSSHAISPNHQCLGHSPSCSSTDIAQPAGHSVVSAPPKLRAVKSSPLCPQFSDSPIVPQTPSVTPKVSPSDDGAKELRSALSSPLHFVSSKGPGQIVSPPVRHTPSTDSMKQLKAQAIIESAKSSASPIFEQGFKAFGNEGPSKEEPDAELVDLEDKVRMLQERVAQQRAQMASLLEELKRREVLAMEQDRRHAEGISAQSNDADDRDTHDSMAPEYQGMEEDADYAGEVYDGAPSAKCPRVTKDNEQ
eukprot:GEMP01034449.1.p1 GENE.GEMP01034449.1~~GEMP01034449.1.p1  ORF type:complete len:386 (+),score=120.69 GEMP01034449.1:217-1374(+)